jgi:hypothetical protein
MVLRTHGAAHSSRRYYRSRAPPSASLLGARKLLKNHIK